MNPLDIFPFEIWTLICNYLDFKSKARLSLVHEIFCGAIIDDLYNIDKNILNKLTSNVLRFKIFENVSKLDISSNNQTANISFMKQLKVLNASGLKCKIKQKSINRLDLIELNASNNDKICNVSFMKNLKVLNASGKCGINQKGIKGLDLIELNASFNFKIKDVSFMKNLKVLHARSYNKFDPECIKLSDSTMNRAAWIPFVKEEMMLKTKYSCGIDQKGIRNLNLTELNADFNDKITDVSLMKNLKILSHKIGNFIEIFPFDLQPLDYQPTPSWNMYRSKSLLLLQ